MSLLKYIDDALEAVFHRKGPDAAKARAKALKTIETAERQFASTDPVKGRRVWRASNDVVAFEPGYSVEGRKIAHIPSNLFPAFLRDLRTSIEAGDYDKALLADGGDDAAPAKARKARTPMSAEARAAMTAKRKATMAARGKKPGRAKKLA